MPRNWPGLGERIHQRVRELGFANLAQFADAKGIRITYIYKWAAGTTPDRDNLERLAKNLEVHPAWLLFGDEVQPFLRRAGRKVVSALLLLGAVAFTLGGVRAEAAPLPLGDQVQEMAHYVKRRGRRWGWVSQWLVARAKLSHQCQPVAPFLPVRLCLT